MTIDGVDETYAAGAFSDEDIQAVDQALRILHLAAGNKELLEQEHGNEIEMIRHGALTDGPDHGGFNDGGQVHLVDASFGGGDWTIEVVLHEIGHFWDSEYDKDGWRDLSGRKKTPADTTGMKHDPGSDYWYDEDADFEQLREGQPLRRFLRELRELFHELGGADDVQRRGPPAQRRRGPELRYREQG